MRACRLAVGLAIGLALLAGGATEAPAQGGCPANGLMMQGAWFGSTSPAMDSTRGEFRVAYDHVAGTTRVRQCCSITGATVLASDDYDITGVPPGTAVTLEVLLTLDGAVWTSGCGGSGCVGVYEAVLGHGADRDTVRHLDQMFSGRREHRDVLRIPLTIVAGHPERVEVMLHAQSAAGGAHGSEALGALAFSGLSPGMAITSCQGFEGEAVPARPVSWGRLKTICR